MKKQLVFILLLTLGSVGFFACQKSDLINNGTTEYGVQFEALNPSFSLSGSGFTKSAMVQSDSINWDSAHLIVSNIKFEAKLKSMVTNEDSIEIEYKWHGPELVDLLNSDNTLGNFTLSPGIYDEIELKVEGLTDDAGSDPVFYLEGIYKNDAGSWPISVSVTQNVYFKTEKENVEVTEEGIDITSVIKLYLDELMADVDPVDLDNANLTDGVIVISADSNTGIYQTIVSNLGHDCRTYYKHKHHGDDHEHNGYDDDHNDD
ncbi:MAG TPA: hypothetical protein PK335_09630 [Draconibacterium sp.]|nr:hypothetical protein [Draconibacterium sp.]